VTEKECAEAQQEIYRSDITDLQAQLEIAEAEKDELLKTKALGNEEIEGIVQDNMKLKQAILKLRDISLRDKSNFEAKIASLQQETSKIKLLQEKLEKMEEYQVKFNESMTEIQTLREQLDAAHAQEHLINELTANNLSLEEVCSKEHTQYWKTSKSLFYTFISKCKHCKTR